MPVTAASAMPISVAREQFADVTNRVAYGHERVVLTRHGRQIAAVIPARDLQLLEALEERIDLDEARTALSASRGKRIGLDELKAELGL
jgi:prevent-host-death family protein